MAESNSNGGGGNAVAGESWWLKVGILYDKSGFRAASLGMLDVKNSAKEVYNAFRGVVSVNSDLYTSAKYLNMSTGDLQKWQRAFVLMNSSTEDAENSIKNLNFAYERLQLGMDSGLASIGARLQLKPEDYLSFDRMMSALNRSFNENFSQNRGAFQVLAEQMGLSKGALSLVMQSAAEFKRTMQEAGSVPFIPEREIKSARELDRLFARISIRWDNFKSRILTATFPGLENLFKQFEKVLDDPEITKKTTAFFDSMSEGLLKITEDKKIKDFIDTFGGLLDIVKGVGTVAGWTAKAAGSVGGAAGSVGGFLQSGNKWEQIKRFYRESTDSLQGSSASMALMPAGWGAPYAAGPSNSTNTNNITVNVGGGADPNATGQAVADRVEQVLAKGQRNSRTVRNKENNAPL